jgi:alkyl hydroperoxide reductase subunit F
MLDQATHNQLKSVYSDLFSEYRFVVAAEGHEAQAELIELISSVAETSPNIELEKSTVEPLHLHIKKDGNPLPIKFRGIPSGHEFTTLILAVLNADGKGKQPDTGVQERIKALKGPIRLTSYVSVSCVNCPDVVQALNQMALIHPDFEHEVVEGTYFQDEVNERGIQGVPAVFANNDMIHVGKADLPELLDKLEEHFGYETIANTEIKNYDVTVIGGGPAGVAAAIYTARKGLKTAIVAEKIGGQVNETKGIENLISIPFTEGPQLAANLFQHLSDYPVDILEYRRVEKIIDGSRKQLELHGGEKITTGALLLATGAKWRQLGIPGEKENIGRGVAFCPHCDGPFYKDMPVAVIGGGNSGVEAAIDLAGICSQVTLVEYADKLNADNVLIDKLKSLKNATIITSAAAERINDTDGKVSEIVIKHRENGVLQSLKVDGIFVQIGLDPNSAPFADLLELNQRGEIPVDDHCRTKITGIYAAGDVTDVPYKQIIIAMGEGAKAGLSSFEDFARGNITTLDK